MLNRSGEIRQPCLIAVFKENDFSCSPFTVMLVLGLSYIPFIMLGNIPSIFSLLRAFFHERVLDFVKGFFCVY
jgi:hypothetical protein